VWATDASPSALDVARANAAGLGGRAAARVRFAEGHWWQALPAQLRGGVHLAVSNPPYIGSDEMRTLDPTVARWEPHHALEAGPTGLEDLTTILAGAAEWLAPAGVVVLELAPHQAEAARAEANRAGFAEAEIRRDLTGRDRALVARRP
jgi:release factor glutamine methyltransferase